MPNIRALTDINVKSIYIPYNRVAFVDDDTAAALVAAGQATDDEGHVEQALQANPEVIEIAVPTAADKAKAAAAVKAKADAKAQAEAEAKAASGSKKTKPAAEEQSGIFGE